MKWLLRGTKMEDTGKLYRWFHQDFDNYTVCGDGIVANGYLESSNRLKTKKMTRTDRTNLASLLDLCRFESMIEKYAGLIQKGNHEDDSVIFPNLYTASMIEAINHAYAREEMLSGLKMPKHQQKYMSLSTEDDRRFNENVALYKRLLNMNFENMQILMRHNLALFRGAKGDIWTLEQNFYSAPAEKKLKELDMPAGSRMIAEQGLLPRYFIELDLAKQRVEKLDLAKTILYKKFDRIMESFR